MYGTEVGYAGGTTPAPTYRSIGDHAEAVQLVYHPDTISLDDLLDRFWSGHDPTRHGRSQYRAELFPADEDQRRAMQRSADAVSERLEQPLGTRIQPQAEFFSAEAYHQKWSLRRHEDVWSELEATYPDEPTLIRAIGPAKLNAYVAGHLDRLQSELHRFGLTPEAQSYLRSLRKPTQSESRP